ncbi:MAG: hypothetical protein CBD27_10060 [Rhodospirillaceae bacterium TMED167]|nr:hypothetical protein [Rhodospirillaceae bacterium]OUW25031.1 MAG: hypothetical protein CBD27_10060 [Rhodospirillaceae bacterium TMED167]
MNVLGLSFGYHDSAAALVGNTGILAAAEEERFSRKKHDNGFPTSAIDYCLSAGGLTAPELDVVVYYENTALKWDRIVSSYVEELEQHPEYLERVISSWIFHDKFDPEDAIARYLGLPMSRVCSIEHHQSHAASAYYCSPFSGAAVVTMDGVGEYETTTISHGERGGLTKLTSQSFPHSLGLLYSAITAFLGFEVNEGEYKVMGMAGFGEPNYQDAFSNLLRLKPGGEFEIDPSYFEFNCPQKFPFNQRLRALLGNPREPGSHFSFASEGHPDLDDQRYADIAASLQKCTEDAVLHISAAALTKTGEKDLCFAGGVGLNSLANARVKKELNCNLFVQPAAGDGGAALGAALHWRAENTSSSIVPLRSVHLGKEYDPGEVELALHKYDVPYTQYDTQADLVSLVASQLAGGFVVGWLQGPFEWGPRALGNRSILANPADPDMQEIVNTKIKFRERFRPFAPSILAERAHEYFDIPDDLSECSPEEFMLSVVPVREAQRSKLPAITHVDGTARLHLVRWDVNSLFYDLIAAIDRQTGVPIVLNTSFNMQGEAMVNTPYDALETFSWSGLDFLVMGNFVVSKGDMT